MIRYEAWIRLLDVQTCLSSADAQKFLYYCTKSNIDIPCILGLVWSPKSYNQSIKLLNVAYRIWWT